MVTQRFAVEKRSHVCFFFSVSAVSSRLWSRQLSIAGGGCFSRLLLYGNSCYGAALMKAADPRTGPLAIACHERGREGLHSHVLTCISAHRGSVPNPHALLARESRIRVRLRRLRARTEWSCGRC